MENGNDINISKSQTSMESMMLHGNGTFYKWKCFHPPLFRGNGTFYQSWALPLQVAVIRYSLLSE
jgi:hypothetical protein